MNRTREYAQIAYGLLCRDMYVLKKELVSRFINAGVMVTIQILVTKYFFPLTGMPSSFIVPLFLSSVIQILYFIGYNVALSGVLDRNSTRIIDYHMTLPIPKKWLFAYYATSFVIESIIITLPLLIVGLGALYPLFSWATVAWHHVIPVYALTLILFSIFFLWISFAYSFSWFMDNAWARRLSPLYLFGCLFTPWYTVKSFSTFWAYVMLANPFTYCIEGLRSSLTGSDQFISPVICSIMLIGFIFLFIWLLASSITKELDPV